MQVELSPQLLLAAYARGIFPMAERRDDPRLHWVDPRIRGVIPIGGLHVSRSLMRRLRRGGFTATLDRAFAEVVTACAAREETWINAPLFEVYRSLHLQGQAHSVEVWQEGRLAGGVFGIALRGAFFGESMVSPATDGSKAALAWLFHLLRAGGFRLFDTQFLTPHLARMGGIEIPRAQYRRELEAALQVTADLGPPRALPPGAEVVAGLAGPPRQGAAAGG